MEYSICIFFYFSSSVSCVFLCLWSRRNYINFLSLIISLIFTNHIFKEKKKVRRLEGSAKLKNTKLDGILYVVMTIILFVLALRNTR